MKVGVVLTDLDGTLLEPDGLVCDEALATLARLQALGIPVCAVTSKTPAELAELAVRIGLRAPAGFENGAGVRVANGALELLPAAVTVEDLRVVLAEVRHRTGVAVRSVEELDDAELAAVTELAAGQLAAVRRRCATLPLLTDPAGDETLRAALPPGPRLRLVRGNRFLHLQGAHDKADVVPRLLALVGATAGEAVALGDAPNDADLLACAGTAVLVPSARGPHPELSRRFPRATVAPLPHGRGWAAAVERLIGGGRP